MTGIRRIRWLVFLTGLPATLCALYLLYQSPWSALSKVTLAIFLVLWWLGLAASILGRLAFSLRTLSNLILGLNEGDFSFRGHTTRETGAYGQIVTEINRLTENLMTQRLGALEATTLLRKVMTEIDAAVFTFDESERLRLVNRAGERLLDKPAEQIIGRAASDLGLGECLKGEAHRTLEWSFPETSGRWGLSRSVFREEGRGHQLLVLSNLSTALREEERAAWQRLLRVLGHELNNSLAPIRSIADNLQRRMVEPDPGNDWREDATEGIRVIAARAEALSRFMEAYSRLARLPKPTFSSVEVEPLVARAASLEPRIPVEVVPGPSLRIRVDEGQIEQVLINLLKNAADAVRETGGPVRIGWRNRKKTVEITVEDGGTGLSGTDNLFVPFFTTKPGGSGIGLALSRQIAEAHSGELTLENRTDARGCIARLVLPLA
jgi:nitrogen fixation/metabolism regulation signal transduction histidine kinase